MAIKLETIQSSHVVLVQYQPALEITRDIWDALHETSDAIVQIHDFNAVEMSRVEIRQALFLLREHDAQQPITSKLHTAIVANGEQGARFGAEIARYPGSIRLIPLFGTAEEAAIYAAMVVVKYQALSA